MTPLTAGAKPATTSRTARREEVDPAHDQHVVGAPDAAHPRRGAAAGAGARPHPHMVAAAEAQERRRPVAQVGIDELALRAVLERPRRAGLRVDQLHMHEAAPGEVHPRLRLALAPERDRDVADPHRLGDLRPPGRLEPRRAAPARRRPARRRRAAAPTLEPARSIPRAVGRLRQVQRIGRRQRHRVGRERLRPPPAAARCCPARPGCGRARAPAKASSVAPATNGPAP